MRPIDSAVGDIRRKVFTEVARLAYEGGDYSRLEELPYKIIPGEVAHYRESIFLERAIVGERLRLAIGLPLRPLAEHAPLTQGIDESAVAEKYYEPPLINIIKFACNGCPDGKYIISNGCQCCLAHPCTEVCPKDAVSLCNDRFVIDQEKCIKCGRCKDACPYGAVLRMERPCAKACGVNAIRSDEEGLAVINQEKCVSCGMCLVNCPFGAISDKGQIFQLIHAINQGEKVVAIIAPAFVGQFGVKVTPNKLNAAMQQLGFDHIVEVAVGADLCTIEEAKDFLKNVPGKQPFMGTSCCPSWSVMAKKNFPEFAEYISMSLTPMVLTARLQKKQDPNCKVVFVGPCASKKLEASRHSVRSDVDFVLTFEELMGMFKAKEVDLDNINGDDPLTEGTAIGRGFPVSKGVAQAVVATAKQIAPEREINVVCAEGLNECKEMLKKAKTGIYDGYLLEGMACPGGCVAGAGTLQPTKKSTILINQYKKSASLKNALKSDYTNALKSLKE